MIDPMMSKYPRQNSESPARVIEGEAVIVTPEDSQLHTLNKVGTFIWERSDGRRTLQSIVAELCEVYEVGLEQAVGDALAFVELCVQRNVMWLGDEPASDSD
jgi:hypothetical protein